MKWNLNNQTLRTYKMKKRIKRLKKLKWVGLVENLLMINKIMLPLNFREKRNNLPHLLELKYNLKRLCTNQMEESQTLWIRSIQIVLNHFRKIAELMIQQVSRVVILLLQKSSKSFHYLQIKNLKRKAFRKLQKNNLKILLRKKNK